MMNHNEITSTIARTFVIALIGAFLFGCGINKRGMIVLADNSYTASMVAVGGDGFDAPDGIRWHNGRLYMADEGGPAFRIWSGANQVETLSDAKDGILSPEDFVVDTDGTVFFTDDDAGGLWRIDTAGKVRKIAGPAQGLISTEGIAMLPTGELLVGDGHQHKVFRVDREGNTTEYLASGITKPESMAFDEAGNLYIADNEDNILYRVYPNKKVETLLEKVPGFSPESIWYSHGRLHITDSDNGKLFEYTVENGLKVVAIFGGKLKKVSGVTTDEAGSIFVTVQAHIDNRESFLLKLQKPTLSDKR